MTPSQHNYEEDIRSLMENLSTQEAAPEGDAAPSANERKAAVRLSGTPVATALSDLPLVLSDVPYEPLGGDLTIKGPENEIELIIPPEDTVSEPHQDDFNEAEFIRQYIFAQIADNEAGGYDDARRASFFGRQFFRRGDSSLVLLGKTVFWLIVAAFAAALVYGTYVLGVQPLIAARQEQQLAGVYDSDADGTVEDHESKYPKGMLASFRGLYDINPQVSGYLQYHAATAEDFLQINYPVVYSGDNTTYTNKNFYGDSSADGALFIDERCGDEDSPVTIIYGKNASNGKMFAGLNSLVGSVYSARVATTLTYNTLFEKGEYQVFAVVLTDESATGVSRFDCSRTDFSSNEELDTYLDAVRSRSLFNYGITATSSDDILVLITDASASVAKINNARIAVFARRVQDGGAAADSLVVKNDNVIMPLSWYTAQKLKLHPYYSIISSTDPTVAGTTTSTTMSGSTTATAAASTTGSATASNTTGTTQPTQTPGTTASQTTPPSQPTQTPETTASAQPTESYGGGGEDGVIEMDELI